MNRKIIKPNMNGPETAPLRKYVEEYHIIVNIFDGENLVRSEPVDYGNYEQKKWLGKLSFWAWEQGYTVETERAN